jgi:hypothetical protein
MPLNRRELLQATGSAVIGAAFAAENLGAAQAALNIGSASPTSQDRLRPSEVRTPCPVFEGRDIL